MRSIFIQGMILAPIALLGACAGEKKKAETKALNIIHIMTDDHSFQTISAYGHPISMLAPTPNIDRLASEGMLFQQAFVENSLSTPSRACLMTGLYSHQNGQRRLGAGIDSTKTFFSELLQEKGYETGVVGKWHMQCEPKGFDFYSVFWDQGDYYNPEFKRKDTGGQYVREEGYATSLITNHAIEFLDNRNKEKPFCLLVHHKAPHRNWMPDTKYLHLYEDTEFPYPETFNDDYNTRSDAARTQEMQIDRDMTLTYDLKVNVNNEGSREKGWQGILGRMTPRQRESWVSAYYPRNENFIKQNLEGEELKKWKYQEYLKDYLRCIKTIDDEVGRLIVYLEKEGLMENTVIVYTSDQGFYMGEHGWFDKRFMYEESFRTPLIIRHPDKPEDLKNRLLVQNIDYAPTYLDIANVEKPESMSGNSLIPLLDGSSHTDWRKDLYYHYYDFPAAHNVRRHDGVRDERYKLIHFYGIQADKNTTINWNELYDLKTDPRELNNLYENPDYAEIVIRLQGRLNQYREDLKVDEF